MEAPHVGRLVEQFRSLVEDQRQFVEELERSGDDATSAKNILDSLRVTLSLHIHHWQRLHCLVEAPPPAEEPTAREFSAKDTAANYMAQNRDVSQSKEEPRSVVLVLPHAGFREGEIPVRAHSETRGQLTKAAGTADDADQDEHFSPGSEFRPLSEEEKIQFLNSMDAKAKKILAELGDKKSLSKSTAA